MLRRHSEEVGICIDDQAALVIDGDKFRVLASDVAGDSERVTKKIVNSDGSITATLFRPSGEELPLTDLVE